MKASHVLLATCAVLLSAGCGNGSAADGDTDAAVDSDAAAIVGLYKLTSDTYAEDCGTLKEQPVPISHYELVATSEGVDVHTCRSATDCNDFPDESMSLEAWKSGKYRSVVTWTYYQADAATCLLDARRVLLDDKGDGRIVLEGVETEQSTPPVGDAADPEVGCERALKAWTPNFEVEQRRCWKRVGKLVE